jgi:conjugal transfer pilus assembly protein TraA
MKKNLQQQLLACNLSKRHTLMLAGLVAVAMAAAPAIAGTTGSEFQGFYDSMKGYATGYLGKGLAIAFFLGGVLWGFAKSTAAPALVGFVIALVLGLGPGVVDTMLSATV